VVADHVKRTINPGDMTTTLHSDSDIHTLKPLFAQKKNGLLNLLWRQKIHEPFSLHITNACSIRENLLNMLNCWRTQKRQQHSEKIQLWLMLLVSERKSLKMLLLVDFCTVRFVTFLYSSTSTFRRVTLRLHSRLVFYTYLVSESWWFN